MVTNTKACGLAGLSTFNY